MPDHSISPNDTGGVPVCRAECPSLVRGSVYSECAHTGQAMFPSTDMLCLPRVRKMGEELAELRRQLDEISQRRCDGCRHRDDEYPPCPARPQFMGPDGCCSRWEAKP
jgi:hypothetical protein